MSPFWNDALAILGGIASLLIILDFLGAREWLQKMKPWGRIRVFLLAASLAVFSVGMYGKYTSSQVTADNLESHVTAWLKAFEAKTQPVSDASIYFGIKVIYDDKTETSIVRSKAFDHYLTLENQVVLGPEHTAIFNKLSDEQKLRFWGDLTTRIYQSRIQATRPGPPSPSSPIQIIRLIPITNDLSEAILISKLDEIHADERIIMGTVSELLDRLDSKPH